MKRESARRASRKYANSPRGREYIRKYTVAHRSKPEVRRARYAYHIRNRYGAEVEDVARLYEAQDRKCPGCLKHLDLNSKGTHLDHCHETGRLRGILCFACNSTLGNVSDSRETLLRLASYLKEI